MILESAVPRPREAGAPRPPPARSTRVRRAPARTAAPPMRPASPPTSERSVVTALRPIASIGCLTVVSGGSVHAISVESSKPTTEKPSGTPSPSRRTPRMTPEREDVARADGSGGSAPKQLRAGSLAALRREHRSFHELGCASELLERCQLPRRRNVIGGAEHHPDPLVAERTQMHDGLPDRAPVIGRDARKPEVFVGGVHQHGRQATLAKPQIVLVVGGRLRIQAAREDHP